MKKINFDLVNTTGVSILIFLDSSFLYVWMRASLAWEGPTSQSLFSWIHLSYIPGRDGDDGGVCRSLNPYFPGFIFLISLIIMSKKRCSPVVSILIFLDSSFLCTSNVEVTNIEKYSLNPYFPGFIFLILLYIGLSIVRVSLSQSLFSWIHLSYNNTKWKWFSSEHLSSQSLFSWIHLSYSFTMRAQKSALTIKSQSLFSWIHLSYMRKFRMENSTLLMSQSLFSWIHLSYSETDQCKTCHSRWCLNPYFPGFIFLICQGKGSRGCPVPVSILIFLDSSFL